MSLSVATWNINSVRLRINNVKRYLRLRKPDVLCLQETKLEDANFPSREIAEAGYQALCSGQRTYNGVAILSPAAGADCAIGIADYEDVQKRVIAASVDGVRVVCAYVPNGESVESDKYQYKLKWLRAFRGWLEVELARYPRLAVLGDFNIAPEARDVYDPKAWEGHVLFSEPQR